ncbi:DUF2470 domain-containing protein [Aspergillus clavatus NRRL 1]|uniref:Integral membrane protein, putative n=1 Tax=Aspergillus clavatus (strain ATCC 1007 / CBS 513.65 / DSM 816 / NCTC 3887 / NRRL 1 / QM 1276 / 107) TaxID=344612 RepID=A1CRN2_ASPCL|nr:integral membrane protein, putative [Aspergillus clavatus NRRL 1]EAW08303.1 integral membrane protein, putative [Aspergillus clavatus NRRL 1]
MADKSKAFIINHMNTGHQDSLVLYLRVYCGLSASAAAPAHLEDLTLSDLLITAHGTRYSIPFRPPLGSLAETRARVVAMHQHCLRELGLSDIVVREYRPPRGAFQLVSLGLIVATLGVFCRRGNFVPGATVYEALGMGRVDWLARFCYEVQPWVVGLLLGAHVVEAVLLAVLRLRPHGVVVFSGLWFMWILSNMVEGFPVWKRMDGLIREEREKKEKRM